MTRYKLVRHLTDTETPHIEVQIPLRLTAVECDAMIREVADECGAHHCLAVACFPDFADQGKRIHDFPQAGTLARLVFRRGLACLLEPVGTTESEIEANTVYWLGGVELWALGWFPFAERPDGLLDLALAREMMEEFSLSSDALRALIGRQKWGRWPEAMMYATIGNWLKKYL